MKGTKKITSLFLAIAVVATAFIGCANGDSTDKSSQAGSQSSGKSSSQKSDDKKDVTIQVICPSNQQEFPSGVTPNDNFIVNYWKEKTGFNFDIVVLPLENSEEKFNVMFNSGEATGIAFTRDAGKVGMLAGQNVLVPVDEYMEDSTFFAKFADYQTMGKYDGKQYGIGIPPDGIPYEGAIAIARKDIMVKNGMTDQPATFEEFNKMLEMFKAEGLVPLVIGGSPTQKSFDLPLSLFGIASDTAAKFRVTNDKIEYKMITEDAKEYLKYMSQLYKDGMIPQDFPALTEPALNELYLSGKGGVVANGSIWSTPSLFTQSEELGYDSKIIDYPTGYKGEKSYGDVGRVGVSLMGVISKDCTYIEEVVDFLDFLIEPETLMINNYGIEGEHYNLVDNVAVQTDAAKDIAWGVYYRNIFLPEDWYPVYGVGAKWAETYYPSERHTVGNPNGDPILHMPINSDMKIKLSELSKTIVDPYFTKVITGEASIDDFDKYVTEWLEAGGQEALDYHNEQWIAMDKPTFEYVSYLPEKHDEYTGIHLFNGKS